MMIQCKCGYEGPSLSVHRGYRWYYFLLLFTGVGIIPVIVLGNLKRRVCPGCWESAGRVPFKGEAQSDAEQLLTAGRARDAKHFRHNQLLVFAVVLLFLAASIAFAIIYGARI